MNAAGRGQGLGALAVARRQPWIALGTWQSEVVHKSKQGRHVENHTNYKDHAFDNTWQLITLTSL